MPTTCRPCFRYLRCHLTSSGTSVRQGGHHVAQKLSSTTLPLKSSSRKCRPPKSFNSSDGVVVWANAATLRSKNDRTRVIVLLNRRFKIETSLRTECFG